MTGKPNRRCEKSRKALEERMESAVKPAAEEIVKYVQAVRTGGPLSIRLNRDFD